MKLIITDLENFSLPVEGEYKIIKPDTFPKNCIGCFGCWNRTPGECVIRDGYEHTGAKIGKCDEMILISSCYCGSVSPFVKMVQDRAISYVSPDFEIRNGEMHHKHRYYNSFSLSAYIYGDDITEAEKETLRSSLKANCLNYDSTLGEIKFYNNAEELEGIVL